jgi:hypothetical protein
MMRSPSDHADASSDSRNPGSTQNAGRGGVADAVLAVVTGEDGGGETEGIAVGDGVHAIDATTTMPESPTAHAAALWLPAIMRQS